MGVGLKPLEIKIKPTSFKSSEHINEKGVGHTARFRKYCIGIIYDQ